jgi:YD repeat-containing protein
VIDTVYPPAPTETVEYDHLGNVRATITPAGTRREMLNDEIGRSIRTRTQIDRAGTLFQKDTVIYDLAGRVLETHAWGPSVSFRDARTNALVALPEEELHVAYAFDDEGNTIAVERWTNPDPSGIGRVQSKWKFDAAGRVVSAVAADGARDTTVYDPAGNATVRVDRNGDTIRTHYDALGRVRRTLLPARTYARRSAYPFERSGVGTFSAFPLYANQPDGSLRVSGDTIEFTYDSAGNMIRARNRDATVVRSYYPNGSLRTDTSKIRTYAELSQGGDTTRHVCTDFGSNTTGTAVACICTIRQTWHRAPRAGASSTGPITTTTGTVSWSGSPIHSRTSTDSATTPWADQIPPGSRAAKSKAGDSTARGTSLTVSSRITVGYPGTRRTLAPRYVPSRCGTMRGASWFTWRARRGIATPWMSRIRDSGGSRNSGMRKPGRTTPLVS